MRVSFIVPIYKKSPEVLKRCLKSLFDQSYKDIEVICVFDGPDESLESIVLEKDFEAVKKFVVPHGGAPKARNAGMDAAAGDIIVFWDADCYIEPDICASWVKLFNERKDIDFIYGNYGFVDPAIPGHRAEPFDAWKLSKYNYICTMTAIRREKCVRWDESLEGYQDWDYFRTLAENGCQGGWLDHKVFETELPTPESISGGTRDQAIARIKTIREKHGDKESDILVVAGMPYHEAERIAKYLDADIFNKDLPWRIKKYRLIALVGFNPEYPQILNWAYKDDGAKNVLFWMGGEAESLLEKPWGLTTYLLKAINKIVHKHYCQDKGTKDRLAEMGIDAEIMDIPRDVGEVSKELPKDFKVLIYGDDSYKQLTDSVVEAMPDIEFTQLDANAPIKLTDYTLYVQFEKLGQVNDAIRTMLVNGRHVISNVQAPYAGYIPLGETVDEFKREVVKAIRAVKKEAQYNQKAHEYWMNATYPEAFAKRVKSMLSPVLEVA